MDNEVLNAANAKRTKLSIKGKIAFVPSLLLTIPFLVVAVILSLCVLAIGKILKFSGIIEAIDFQLNEVKQKINLKA
jgi:hypothetical protein